MKIGREPALVAISLLAPAVQLACAFFVHDPALQGSLNGVAALLAGVLVAALVKREKLAPAILGFAQAVLALALQLGFPLTAMQQAAVMGFVSLAVAAFLRTQVTAAVGPDGSQVEQHGRHERPEVAA